MKILFKVFNGMDNLRNSKGISGCVLAGGDSSRMKTDKGLLKINNVPIIEMITNKLKKIFKEILVISNSPEKYYFIDYAVFRDIIPQKGPLGGIYTALKASENFYNFVVACDMPFINPKLIQHIIDNVHSNDVVIPQKNGRLEPLFAVYSKSCLPYIEKELGKGNLRITTILDFVKSRIISEEEVMKYDKDGLSFVNINTPEDYRRFNYE